MLQSRSRIKTRPLLLATAAILLGLLSPLVSIVPAAATVGYENGFEIDTVDWNGPVTRVPSGTDGVTSSEGDYHATLDGPAYSFWGGSETEWPEGGYVTEIDVYLDMTLADGQSSDTIQWNSSINDPNGDFLEEAFFQIRTDPDTANQWNIRIAIVYTGYGGFTTTDWVDLTETGWYTLRHTFYEGDGGLLEIALEAEGPDDTIVISHVWDELVDYSVSNGDVGGDRYGWFSDMPFEGFPIDNAIVRAPEPDLPHPGLDTVCVNALTGQLMMANPTTGCGTSPYIYEVDADGSHVFCYNPWTGKVIYRGASPSATCPGIYAPVDYQATPLCVHAYNNQMRVAPTGVCSPVEYGPFVIT